jgi:hypothetical protein
MFWLNLLMDGHHQHFYLCDEFWSFNDKIEGL